MTGRWVQQRLIDDVIDAGADAVNPFQARSFFEKWIGLFSKIRTVSQENVCFRGKHIGFLDVLHDIDRHVRNARRSPSPY